MKHRHSFAIGAAIVLLAGVLVAANSSSHKASFEFEVESLTDIENPMPYCDVFCKIRMNESCTIQTGYGYPVTCYDMTTWF